MHGTWHLRLFLNFFNIFHSWVIPKRCFLVKESCLVIKKSFQIWPFYYMGQLFFLTDKTGGKTIMISNEGIGVGPLMKKLRVFVFCFWMKSYIVGRYRKLSEMEGKLLKTWKTGKSLGILKTANRRNAVMLVNYCTEINICLLENVRIHQSYVATS